MDSKSRAKEPSERHPSKPVNTAPVTSPDSSRKKNMPPVRDGANRRLPPSAAPMPELKKEPEPEPEPEPELKATPDVTDVESVSEDNEESKQVSETADVAVLDLATEILHVGADHRVLEELRTKIRRAIAELRVSEYRKEETELIEEKIAVLGQLLEEYKHVADVPFHFELPDLLSDVLTEFYFVMANHREKETLELFYDDSISLTLPDIKPIVSRKKAINAWLDAFKGSSVECSIVKIDVDIPVRDDLEVLPTAHPRRYDAFVTVSSRLKVDTDSPRKILEMFEFKRVQEPPPSPVHTLSEASERLQMTTIYPRYHIIRHVFIVQDARPLYCFPFQNVPRTKYDNWENQFRPDDWEDMQSIASTVTKVSKGGTIKDESHTMSQSRLDDGSILDDEDDGSSVVSGAPSIESAAQAKKEETIAALMNK